MCPIWVNFSFLTIFDTFFMNTIRVEFKEKRNVGEKGRSRKEKLQSNFSAAFR